LKIKNFKYVRMGKYTEEWEMREMCPRAADYPLEGAKFWVEWSSYFTNYEADPWGSLENRERYSTVKEYGIWKEGTEFERGGALEDCFQQIKWDPGRVPKTPVAKTPALMFVSCWTMKLV
jgi:hypothetical protein